MFLCQIEVMQKKLSDWLKNDDTIDYNKFESLIHRLDPTIKSNRINNLYEQLEKNKYGYVSKDLLIKEKKFAKLLIKLLNEVQYNTYLSTFWNFS